METPTKTRTTGAHWLRLTLTAAAAALCLVLGPLAASGVGVLAVMLWLD